MSSSRRQSHSDSSSKIPRSEPPNLRPLAPKARAIAPRPPVNTSPTASSLPSRRSSPGTCPICLRLNCQLLTHKAFGTSLARHESSLDDRSHALQRGPDPGFTASYAFTLAQPYANRDAVGSSSNAFYKLPIKPERDTAEMHQLFHDFFAIESQTTFRIPRPQEMASDLLLSPFFVPALHDSALCLSILATAAAIIPTSSAKPARNVTSFALIGETMQEMRERFVADPHQISDVTIVAATFLWLVNIWLEDVDAIDSHATSVVTFVNARGGLAELGMVGTVAQLILWTDVLSSLVTGQPCHFPDDPDSDLEITAVPQRSGIYWTVPHTPTIESVHPAVVMVCQQTSQLIDSWESAVAEGMSARIYLFIVQRLCSICKKEIQLRVKLHATGSPDECILLAVGLIKTKVFCANHHVLTILTVRGAIALAQALQSLPGDIAFWQADMDLLIWLLFSLLIVDHDFDEREWALAMLHQAVTAKFGSPVGWLPTWPQDLNQTLIGFAWSNTQLSQEFRTICRSIANTHGLELTES